MNIDKIPFVSAGVGALCLVACASAPVPADKLARSQAAVRSAEEMNAEAHPDSALYLKLAREQLEDAKKILKDGDNGRAAYVLQRAEADAQLALNLAKEKAARLEAQKTIENVQQIKTQMEGTKS
jgi:hypothetical protein